MSLVKVQRIGNRNVILLPPGREARGFAPGAAVQIDVDEDGSFRVTPVADVDSHVRGAARAAIHRRGRPLDILKSHDEERAEPPRLA